MTGFCLLGVVSDILKIQFKNYSINVDAVEIFITKSQKV